MLLSTPMGGGPLAYRGPQTISAAQRSAALVAVVGLHLGVIGVLVFAQMHPPAPPPQPTLTVSFITESPVSSPAPTPPQPTPPPPPPKAQMLSTPSPTPSPMTAPPFEKVVQPTPAAPAPPSPAPPSPPAPVTAGPAAPAGPSRTASYLKNPAMAYPLASRRLREQGVVMVRVQIGADGVPVQTILARSSGSANLDNAALDFVKKYARFSPSKEGDRAVAGWVVLPFEFSLTR